MLWLLPLGLLYALRPGVVENSARSPRVWLVVAAIVLLGRTTGWVTLRLSGRRRVASCLSLLATVAASALVVAPSFQQREVFEAFPAEQTTALTAAATQARKSTKLEARDSARAPSTVAPSPSGPGAQDVGVESPPATPDRTRAADTAGSSMAPSRGPEPALRTAPTSARLLSRAAVHGIRHHAEGRTALYELRGRLVLRFEGVDVEGTPGPEVHLVGPGGRTPEGGVPLGRLKAERGSFSYTLPDDADPEAGWTVLIWCGPFATPIAASDHGRQ